MWFRLSLRLPDRYSSAILRKEMGKHAVGGVVDDRAETCQTCAHDVMRDEDPVDTHGKRAEGSKDSKVLAHDD